MIQVVDLPDTAPQPSAQQLMIESLTGDDESQLHYLDAVIERAALEAAASDMFCVSVSTATFRLKVLSALKKLWESGGWVVGVFQFEDKAQIVFAKQPAPGPTPDLIRDAFRQRDAVAPAHAPLEPRGTREPTMSCPLLVRMPTRGRPGQALQTLGAYRKLASGPVQIEVVLDEDDESMIDTAVLQALAELDCVITVGRHRSKIEAVNGGRVDDWAILALASDDMMPVVPGYDARMIAAMDRSFPLRDGAVYFDDGYNKSNARPGKPVLCTMPIMGRHLWEDFGHVYHPEYGSLYSDNEQTELLTAMRRMAFFDELLVEHRHHAAGKAAFDMVYQYNDSKWGAADKALFGRRAQLRRPGAQFAFDSPPLVLSLLVCSTHERAPFLRRLVRDLRGQMRGFPRRVELLVDVDAGAKTIGHKRNDLLERALGQYVAFIDDDDWVAHDYIARLLGVLDGEVDCAALEGIVTSDGKDPHRFIHTVGAAGWHTEGDVHWRTPNHLNAVKRSLALEVRFPDTSAGEDHDYSRRLRPLLKTEAAVGSTPLYFYWCRSRK